MKKIIYILFFIIFNSSFLIHNCLCQWVQMSNRIGTKNIVWSLASNGNSVFAGTYSGVYITTNNGENWSLTSLNNKAVIVLLVDGNNIYAGTNTGIFRSTNNGQNWTQIGINNRTISALAVIGNNIFAGNPNNYGVYRSTNNGLTWTQTSLNNKPISSLAIAGNNPDTSGYAIIAGDWISNSVFLSTNNGDNWAQINLGGTNIAVVMCLAVNGNDVFAGTDNRGVFHSSNGGTNWYSTSFNDGSVLSFNIRDNNIFAGLSYISCSQWGVYLSTNNGLNWIDKTQGLDNLSIWSLTTTSQYIYAGTDSGVYRREYLEIISVKNISSEVPTSFALGQNYPNPFNPETKIRFSVPRTENSYQKTENRKQEVPSREGYGFSRGVGLVKLVIYDALGREIETLVNEELQPGTYEVTFNGSGCNSGVYFYRLVTDGFSETKRMLLIK